MKNTWLLIIILNYAQHLKRYGQYGKAKKVNRGFYQKKKKNKMEHNSDTTIDQKKETPNEMGF